jgi:hypothetical protein
MISNELKAVSYGIEKCVWFVSDWHDVSGSSPRNLYRTAIMRKKDGKRGLVYVGEDGRVNIHEVRGDHSVINLELADPKFFIKLKTELDDA